MKTKILIPALALILTGCFSEGSKQSKHVIEEPIESDTITKANLVTNKVVAMDTLSQTESPILEIEREAPTKSTIPYEKIEAMVPDHFSIVKTEEGLDIVFDDFNQDGLTDAAFLVVFGEKEVYSMENEVMIYVVESTKSGTLERMHSTGNLTGMSIQNQKRQHLSTKNGVLSYHHENMRNDLEIKYRFDRKEWSLMQIGKEYQDYGSSSSPPFKISINYLTGKKIMYPKAWDEKTEELIAQPEIVTNFEAFQMPLHMLDFESLYAQIEEDTE